MEESKRGDESDPSLLRTGRLLREAEPGVMNELKDGDASETESSSSKDGMESLDIVLVDKTDSRPASLSGTSSYSPGGLNKKSRGLLPSDMP